jgi:hypothetical protein
MSSFLNCNIWSLFPDDRVISNHYLVEKVYEYNSDNDDFNRKIEYITVQVPEFEIANQHLLSGIDYNIVNQYKIPIVKKLVQNNTETWTIDLTYYDAKINSMQP